MENRAALRYDNRGTGECQCDYSREVVLFEFIIGGLAFVSMRFSTLIQQLIDEVPPTITILHSELPETLANVVDKALGKGTQTM